MLLPGLCEAPWLTRSGMVALESMDVNGKSMQADRANLGVSDFVSLAGMTDATQRFTGRAADYQQYRERYDAEVLLPRLRAWCGLTPQWVVADMGAGTGMLADVFLANGNRVLAVEPNAEMRAACAALHANDARMEVVDGTAEASTLAAQSVDLIGMGRAFHWFDVDRAMEEFRRVLKQDGWVVSVVLGRAQEGSEANLAVEALLASFTGHQRHTCQAQAKHARLQAILARDFHHEELEGAMEVTEAELFGLLRSASHAPRPEDPGYSDLESGTGEIFARYAVDGRMRLVTRYGIDVGRF